MTGWCHRRFGRWLPLAPSWSRLRNNAAATRCRRKESTRCWWNWLWPVEVVPVISAAIGCAAQAQLPLTHRDAASAVSFVAGQCKGLADQDWSGLAGNGRTLVIYMGVATAADIADKLIADGVSPAIPVAVLENGTRSDMRTLRTLLADLGDMVEREKVKSPALIVVGDVAAYALAQDALAGWAAQMNNGAEMHS